MTSDGVDGTAADGQPGAKPRDQAAGPPFIKRDDGRLAPRYIEPAYPHTPAGVTPNNLRRERQVASALRNTTDFEIASFNCGADGTAGGTCADPRLRVRPAASGAVGGHRVERAPPRPAKGSR
jgi:hypothetical protein